MRTLNLLLALVLLGMIAAHAVVRPSPEQPNVDVMPEMVHSPAAEPYAASPLLANNQVLQPPPPGVVARGVSLERFEANPAGAERAAAALVAPPAEDGDAARGASVYATFCTPCHGADGLGQGSVVARGFPAPPSLLAPKATDMKDGHLFHIITYGQMNMPGYAGQIGERDRWRAIAHVRALQRSTR